jgi:hypothetical protein
MKQLLQLLLLLTPVLFSCDDYDKISDNQEQSFMKFFGGGLEDEGMKVLNTDEGYLIMGNILNQGKGHDICVIFTDKYGNSTSPIMVYGGEFDDYGYGIAEVNTEGYVIVGSTVSEEGDKQVFIVKITLKGDTLWTKNYGNEFDDEAFDVLVRENGNLILCGYTEVNELNKDYLLIETNANGELIRFKNEGRAIESEVAQSLVQVDSKFLLAGYSYGSSETNKKALAILWDGISQPTAKPFTIGLHSQANSICGDGNNGYYMACTVQPDPSIQSDIYILKLNQYLEEDWRKSFGERARNVVSDIAFYDNFLLINGTHQMLPEVPRIITFQGICSF